jgi:hypothetical protein
MPRRPTRHFEVIKTELPPSPRRSIAGGRFRSGPHRSHDRQPEIERDEADGASEEPETQDDLHNETDPSVVPRPPTPNPVVQRDSTCNSGFEPELQLQLPAGTPGRGRGLDKDPMSLPMGMATRVVVLPFVMRFYLGGFGIKSQVHEAPLACALGSRSLE